MEIKFDWLRDFIEVDTKIEDKSFFKNISKLLTLSTCEVEEVQFINEHFAEVVVAKIIKVEKHPQADKLNLVTFEYGENKTHTVVCGAPNVSVGLFVPYARLGTVLPSGIKLEKKNIRGIDSTGMLCSGLELGLNADQEGLLVLNDKNQGQA